MRPKNQHSFDSSARSDQAVIFVDYDNLYSILKAQSSRQDASTRYAEEILDEVRRYLEEGDDTPTIMARAYADYGTLPGANGADIQASLDRNAVEPVFTPIGLQSNASELRLCVDATTLLAERGDLQTFVIVTGDRPYLPLVRRIREQGRRALVAAVNPPRPDDAPAFAEEDVYLDARNLLSQSSRDDLLGGRSNARNERSRRSTGSSNRRSSRASRDTSPPPRRYRDITNPIARRTIEITEEHFGQYKEVYLTPLLRKLSDVLGEEHDPKSLVSELEAAGAVRLEKRDGYPYDYTVLIMNEDHPDVQQIQDDYYSRGSSYSNGSNYSQSSSSHYDDYNESREYDDYGDDYDDEYSEDYSDDYDEGSDEGYDDYSEEDPSDDDSYAEEASDADSWSDEDVK